MPYEVGVFMKYDEETLDTHVDVFVERYLERRL